MGKVPEDWRMADATAAFRKGVEDGVCNLEVGWPHLCSWGGDVTACCRCHCHVTGGEGMCKEQSRWMDRGEVMPDQKGEGCSGELCREGWLEQVCGFPSSGMKEVREGDPQARPLGGGLWRSLCRFRPEAGCWWCERGAPVEQGWKVRGRSCPGGMELMERGPLMLE